MYYVVLFVYVDISDSSNNAAVTGAIIGVVCTVIMILVIANIMVWIYCYRRRKRHHIGTYIMCIHYIHKCMHVYTWLLAYTCTYKMQLKLCT